MRVVAKFQFTAPAKGDFIADEIGTVIDNWVNQKFKSIVNGVAVIRRSGLTAVFDRRSETINGARKDSINILEPVDGGSLQTDVDVLSADGRTAFRCMLSIGSDAGVSPANVPLRSPRFIRECVAIGAHWTIGKSGERIFAQSFFIGVGGVSDLEALILAPQRRLPIIVVSELVGETLAGDLRERLSQDTCGLAHTVYLSHDATFEMTKRMGKEWSCYNGAVRLFWPLREGNKHHRSHPLWTYDQILSRAASEAQARERFRNLISGRVIEASTFVADDSAFRDFDSLKIKIVSDQARAAAVAAALGGGDIQALANSYAAENDVLRAKVAEQNREIDDLRDNVEVLSIALRNSPVELHQVVDSTPPQTVEEAVAIARRTLGDLIVIAPETDSDIVHLNPVAGPPDKILRYLQTMRDLAIALEDGVVGLAIPMWLRERGVECSVDSESMKNSREGRIFRLRTVNGESVECEFHAKPADGVSPDRCVRIYFAISEQKPFVKIGYIGRHNV